MVLSASTVLPSPKSSLRRASAALMLAALMFTRRPEPVEKNPPIGIGCGVSASDANAIGDTSAVEATSDAVTGVESSSAALRRAGCDVLSLRFRFRGDSPSSFGNDCRDLCRVARSSGDG
jgi:hypothetical protein